MRAPADRVATLASPPFLVALTLLVLNDFVLKPLFHNELTGKLSDFAGLFALTLFAATLWPRGRWVAGAVISVAFAFWKTAHAEPFIGWLNALSPVDIGRTVDLTDLVALPMVPLAAWVAPRLAPWPLPRALRVALALLAPLAFTATSRLYPVARTTVDLPASTAVDEHALQELFDEVAERHGLRCTVCDPLGEGRIYGAGLDGLTVNFDAQGRTLYFAATDTSRRAERDLAGLTAEIRALLDERFPGLAILESTSRPDRPLEVTTFTIRVAGDHPPSVERSEGARRALSSIVEDVVLAHGLRAGERAYFAGRRRSPWDRDFTVTPELTGNATLQIQVMRYTPSYEALHRAVAQDFAERLDAAFGPGNVISTTTPPP